MTRLKRLAHVNIRCARLSDTIAFYVDVLGLVATPVPGADDMEHRAWLRDPAGEPVLHAGDLDVGTGGTIGAQRGSGAVDHIAFEGSDPDGFARHLDALGCGYRRNSVPAARLEQLFVKDPDGILIELNFFAEDD